MPPTRRLLALLLALLLPTLAHAGAGHASEPAALFVPLDRVPLSEFVHVEAGEVATLHVDADVLDWVLAQPLGRVDVAIRDERGTIHVGAATWVQQDAVYFYAPFAGDCVAVTRDLRHVLRARRTHSIVTHWDGSGRGTVSPGAKDGLMVLDYDPLLDLETVTGTVQAPPGALHTWDTANKNLFSDGSGEAAVEDALVPAFERYIGETYTLNAVTNLRAVRLSDTVRLATGRPVAHYNQLADTTDGAPVFQLVHAQLVDIGDLYPGIVGDENSLATYVLPPGWTSAAAPDSYPILFNGFYDVHGSVFDGLGQDFMATLAQVHAGSGGADLAVGLLWNGGGALVTPTLHRSAWDNAAQLIADAANRLRADPDAVVFVGGSRGATTALAMASNPYGAPYTAAAVHAKNPQVDILEAMYRYLNPSYFLIQRVAALAMGYQDAWQSTWTIPAGEPAAGTPRDDLLRQVLWGTLDDLEIAADYTVNSPKFLAGLEAADPELVLDLGTHDYSKPFAQVAEYVNALEGTSLTVLCQVFYRQGHRLDETPTPDWADLLERLFMKRKGLTPPPLTTNPGGVELQHFGTDPADPHAPVPIAPPHIPVLVEMPIVVGDAQDFSVIVVGQPGATVQVFQAPMDLAGGWEPGLDCVGSEICTATSGSCLGQTPYPACFAAPSAPVMPTSTLSSGPVFGISVLDVDHTTSPLTEGYWWMECFYAPEGGQLPQFGEGDLSLVAPLGDMLPAGLTQILNPCTVQFDYPFHTSVYDQPLFRVTSCAPEVLGWAEITRTGGLSGDGVWLP